MQNRVGSETPPATFRFKDIGPVNEAELELGDLTIIAGRNNTGKTYIAYTLYGFLKMWRNWPYAAAFLMEERASDARFPDIHGIAAKVEQEGHASFPLDESTLDKQRRETIQELSRTFSEEFLPSVFSSQNEDFEGSSIDVNFGEINIEALYSTRSYNREVSPISIEYDGIDVNFSLDRQRNSRLHLEEILLDISHRYFLFLLAGIFPDPFGSVRNSVFGPWWPDPVGPTVLGHCSSSVGTGRPSLLAPAENRRRAGARSDFHGRSTGAGPCVAQAPVGRRWKSRPPVTTAPPRTARRSGSRAPDALGASRVAAPAIFAPRRAAPNRSALSPRGRRGSALGFVPPGAPWSSGSRSRWSCRPPGGSAGRTRRTEPPALRRCASCARSRGTSPPRDRPRTSPTPPRPRPASAPDRPS